MKKLMIAAFAAAAACAFADIESTNIVGYQVTDAVSGFNFYSPQFKAIGSDVINIQNIKLGEGRTDWTDNLQVLDEGGATIATYLYCSGDESGLDEDGWLNSSGTGLADATIAPGLSVLVETADEAKIINAGEVSTAAAEIVGVAGFNFVGNSSPVAINIQDIKLGEGATDWSDNLQILDEGGATIETYIYCSADESGLDADGWLNAAGTALADVTLQPGQGIIVETEGAGVKITLPAAK